MNRYIYTDGSCKKGNKGGYAVIEFLDKEKLTIGFRYAMVEEDTTNNQMELKAFIVALEYVAQELNRGEADEFTIVLDSSYVLSSYLDWSPKWEERGWIKSNKKPVENLDLIKKIYSYRYLISNNRVNFQRVKGHSGNPANELVDAMATLDKKKVSKYLGILGTTSWEDIEV